MTERTDKAETWGDLFATEYDDDPDNVDLNLRRCGGRAKYVLDVEDEMPWDNPSDKKPPNCS